jgi:hypothetical protein
MFKRIEGTLPNGNPKTLFRAIALNTQQFALVQGIIAFHNGETKLTRKQILACNETLRPGKAYMPYFISKNVACRRSGDPFGIYDLSGLKASSGKSVVAVPAKKEKKAKAKKEAKAKKGPKVHVPVVTPTGEMTVAGETLKDKVLSGEMSFTDAVSEILAS